MIKIASGFGYDYYTGWNKHNVAFFNLVPINQPAPNGGYYSKDYILSIKKVPNLFIH